MNCYFCQKPSEPDGTTYHHPNCAGLEESRMNNLQVHSLKARIDALETALREATDFVDRHSEPWYKSGQELLKMCRDALSSPAGKDFE